MYLQFWSYILDIKSTFLEFDKAKCPTHVHTYAVGSTDYVQYLGFVFVLLKDKSHLVSQSRIADTFLQEQIPLCIFLSVQINIKPANQENTTSIFMWPTETN